MKPQAIWNELTKEWNESLEKKAFSILNKVDLAIENAIKNHDFPRMKKYLNRHEQIADKIVSWRLPLVFNIADEYHLNGHTLGQALGIGNQSLMLTVDIYHPEQRIRFETLVKERLHHNLLVYLIDSVDEIKTGSPAIRFLFVAERVIQRYKTQTGRFPTIEFVLKELNGSGLDPLSNTELRADMDDICLNYFANPLFRDKNIGFQKKISEVIADTLFEMDFEIRKEMMLKMGIVKDDDTHSVKRLEKQDEEKIVRDIKKKTAENIELY